MAELQAAYGRPAPGGPAERMAGYVAAWGSRRAVDPGPGGGRAGR